MRRSARTPAGQHHPHRLEQHHAVKKQAVVLAAYPPETLARLIDVKRRYDPDNLLRSNLNIRPDPDPYGPTGLSGFIEMARIAR